MQLSWLSLTGGWTIPACPRNASKRLETCRHVHAVAIDTTVWMNENITEMDTDTKQHAAVIGSWIIPFREGFLGSHGTEDGIRHAVEHSEDAVSRGIHDASIIRIAQPPEYALAFSQGGHGPWLVIAHQPAVASHIGAQDGCEPASGLGHAYRSSTKMERGREAELRPIAAKIIP
jgi:hypothetical protein